MVGHSNESSILFCGVETQALIDSGSNITTVSDEFYRALLPRPKLLSLDSFNLKVQCAGGNNLSYTGCIEAVMEVPFLPNTELAIPVLVVPATEYSSQVPIVIGTNVIRECRKLCDNNNIIPDEWNNAFVSIQKGCIGVVKSTNKYNLKIQPNESITVSGYVRKISGVDTAVTEATQGASSRIGVCPRVIKLDTPGTGQRIPVRLYNISAKMIEIAPKSNLCELQEVNVLRPLDLDQKNKTPDNIHVQQHTAEFTKEPNVLDEIDLEENNLSEGQKLELRLFLSRWRHLFSSGITDLGNCDLVKHKINLSDNVPFKEPYRRVPPALFQEIREHLTEMLQAGTIKHSQSPYSSNIVIVRKKDGSIRFCVDFRKLNSKTVKDAYAIPRIIQSYGKGDK